jgi:hypothetical protein
LQEVDGKAGELNYRRAPASVTIVRNGG